MLPALAGLRRSGQALSKLTGLACVSTSAESSQAAQAVAASTQSGKPPLFKEFNVYRWNPDSPDEPKYTTYKVDINRYVTYMLTPRSPS
jgi:succinate dehydrogenase (ubiquinone) iron-sulfur subunit